MTDIKKTIDNLDLSKYTIRFNQKNFKQLFIIKDNKIKHTLTFNFIGLIDLSKNIFIWANSIPGVNKEFSDNVKTIKNLNINYQDFSKPKNEIIFQFLSENILHFNNTFNHQNIKELLHTITQKPIIFTNSNPTQIQVLQIISIDQSY